MSEQFRERGVEPDPILETSRTKGAPPDVLAEEEDENEKAFRYQEAKFRELWDLWTSEITERDRRPTGTNGDLEWFCQRFERTKKKNNGRGTGGLRSMMVDMVSDPNIAHIIDENRQSLILPHIFDRDISSEVDTIYSELSEGDNDTKERLQFLERLFDSTSEYFQTSWSERDSEQADLNIVIWGDLLSRFRQMRIEVIRRRFEQFLPEINRQKQEIARYYHEDKANTVSANGIGRLRDVNITIGDEYLDSGTEEFGWPDASYNSRKDSIHIQGREALDRDGLSRILGHEFTHVVSGHGEKTGQSEGSSDHIVSRVRVGIGEHAWLNEALTETLYRERIATPDDERSYPIEREMMKQLLLAYSMDRRDLEEWYFTEGNSEEVQVKLEKKYPKLFPALERMKSASKGGKAFENIRTKDDLYQLTDALLGDEEGESV